MVRKISPLPLLPILLLACAKPQPQPSSVKPVVTAPTVGNRYEASKWDSVSRPSNPPYPQLAKIAGISGLVNFRLWVGPSGKVTSADRISGPVQLCSTVDAYSRNLQFPIGPQDGVGPWYFDLYVQFNSSGLVLVGPDPANLK